MAEASDAKIAIVTGSVRWESAAQSQPDWRRMAFQ